MNKTTVRIAVLSMLPMIAGVALSAVAEVSKPNAQALPSYDELKKLELNYPLHQLHAMSDEGFRKTTIKVLEDLDPRCLSSSKCRVVYSVFYTENGVPRCKKIVSEDDTAADDFYCEQAIWENVMPSFAPGKQMLYEFRGGAINDYGEHRELVKMRRKGLVTLHLIPRHFPGSDVLLPLGWISDEKNVLLLSEKKLEDPRLEQFRLEWFTFWKPPTSTEEIAKKANQLRKKYSDLFAG